MVRVRHVGSKAELERLVDEYVVLGFKVKDMGDHSAKVKKVEYGSVLQHVAIFILTVWWTFFLGNVAFAVLKALTGEEIVIKVEEEVV